MQGSKLVALLQWGHHISAAHQNSAAGGSVCGHFAQSVHGDILCTLKKRACRIFNSGHGLHAVVLLWQNLKQWS